jgi:hypothetical protein
MHIVRIFAIVFLSLVTYKIFDGVNEAPLSKVDIH